MRKALFPFSSLKTSVKLTHKRSLQDGNPSQRHPTHTKMPSSQTALERRRAIEAEKRESRRREINTCWNGLWALWYAAWILMLASGGALFFIGKTLAERLVFVGLIGLGIVMAFYAVSWALILGTEFA